MQLDTAIGKAYTICDMPCDDTTLKEFIEDIYDDFESRVCKNCKFYIESIDDKESEMVDMITGCSQIYIETNYLYSLKDFGCNKFERK